MKTFSVRNYRAFEDSKDIKIKPFTAIVGKNSAGKSSLIRLFPLLKQTVERRTAEPILWYGDYVDFGDFSNAISKNSGGETIGISFSIDIRVRDISSVGQRRVSSFSMIPVNVDLELAEHRFDKITITFWDQRVEIIYDEKEFHTISINGDFSVLQDSKLFLYGETGNLIPTMLEIQRNTDAFIGRGVVSRKLLEQCARTLYGKAYDKVHELLYYRNIPVKISSQNDILMDIKKINPEKFSKYKLTHKRFQKINNLIIACKLDEMLDYINEAVNRDLRSTKYIKPIRAMVDRYYRIQGVSVDEIDSDGSNLPMVLHNMSQRELQQFETWSKEKFGVVFSVQTTTGHISLVIKDNVNGNGVVNLADTGYGYSQMLPIIMVLWKIHSSGKNREIQSRTIVIEQPELHLHPAFQAKMVEVFASVIKEAKENEIDLKIIFETHSETMINRIGSLIYENRIEADDVNLLVVNKVDNHSEIESIEFDQEGRLMGWPIDFFSSEVYE